MSTATSNYGLVKPAVNNAIDADTWGESLNDDMDELDGLVKTALNWTPSAKTANFSVTAPTTGSATTGSARIFYLCDTTSGAITASLPAAAGCSGMVVAFKKTDAAANNVIIDGNASETIDGALTYTISTRYSSVTIQSDGTKWNVLCTNANLTAYLTTALAAATYAPLADAPLTGNPTAPTQSAGNSSTRIATTAFVNSTALTLASGTTATTQSPGDNSTKVATTAYVAAASPSVPTALGVGAIILAVNNTLTIAANATTSASNLSVVTITGSAQPTTGDSITGTWKALQTVTSGRVGLFIRTA